MENFKGTQEEWIVDFFEGTVNSKQGKLICDVMPTSLEDKANALLISKSPKILDMLNRISGEMLRSDFVLGEKWYIKIKELIKEATEL